MGTRQGSAAQAISELESYLARSARAHLKFHELEQESERRGREAVRRALQAHLDDRGRVCPGAAVVVKDDNGGEARLTHRRRHTRRLISISGELSLTRWGFGARGQAFLHPLDAELGLPKRAYSYEYQRRLARAVICGPFDEAIALMAEMSGQRIPKRLAEQVVVEVATDFEDFYASREGASPGAGEILVGAIDCKGIPMVKPQPAQKVVRRKKGERPNKKKMATVAAVFSQAPHIRKPKDVLDSLFATSAATPLKTKRRRPTNKRVWASLSAGKDAFISDVHAEMCRRDPEQHHTWVIVTDGERALQKRVLQMFKGVTLVLDLPHALEYLWKAAHALHPEGSPEAQAFVYERAGRILNGQSAQVVKGLRQIVTKRRLRGNKAKALLSAADYYHANRERMRYDIYLAKGWPIGSGAVEGTCKCLVRDRFERSGMRWSAPMAEALLRLRATYLSGDFDEYFAFYVRADQRRLYRKQEWRLTCE